MGRCDEEQYHKHSQSLFHNALCLHHFDNSGLLSVLDDVPEEDEHPAQSNHPNAQHDTFQIAAQV